MHKQLKHTLPHYDGHTASEYILRQHTILTLSVIDDTVSGKKSLSHDFQIIKRTCNGKAAA